MNHQFQLIHLLIITSFFSAKEFRANKTAAALLFTTIEESNL